MNTSGVTPTRSQTDRKSDSCASSLHHPCLLGHPGTPGAQLATGTKPPCSPSPRHWTPVHAAKRSLGKQCPVFSTKIPCQHQQIIFCPGCTAAQGGGGRKLLDQAQVRLSHAPAGKLGGSWGPRGIFVIQLQKSDAINIWYWIYWRLTTWASEIGNMGVWKLQKLEMWCIKPSETGSMGVWKVTRSPCFGRDRFKSGSHNKNSWPSLKLFHSFAQ